MTNKLKVKNSLEGDEKNKTHRFMSLEGLRGLAAIAVVVYHIILIFYPNILYGTNNAISSPQHMRFEDNLHGNIFAGLYSGIFAVAIFFVLSGFVLSVGFFQTGRESIVKKLAAKRYIRLMVPALASVVIAYIIIATGLSSHREAAVGIIGGGSASIQWNFEPNILEAIKQGVLDVFITGQDTYNRVLWTMFYEFIGSFMVFAVLLIWGDSRYRNILYMILLIPAIGTWFMGFVIGMIIADNLRYIQQYFQSLNTLARRVLLTLILTGGGILGGYPVILPASGFYNYIKIEPLSEVANLSLYLTLGATMIIIVVLNSSRVRRVLERPIISGLGKYTYSLYLTHMLVLLSLTTCIFTLAHKSTSYNLAVLIGVTGSIPAIILVTHAFYIYVDRFALKASARVADKMYKKNKLPDK